MAGMRDKALDKALEAMFDTASATGVDWPAVVKSEYTWKLWGHSWIRRILRAFFMGEKLDKPPNHLRHRDDDYGLIPEKLTLPHEADPMYPPNINRRRYKENLDILLESREVRLRHPIQWQKKLAERVGYEDLIREKYRDKDDEQLRSEAEDLLEVLTLSLPSPHFDKLMARLSGFARLESDGVGSWVAKGDVSGGWSIEDDNSSYLSPLPELPQSKEAARADYKKRGITGLGELLRDCSLTHSHLVAVALADFFYVDVGAMVKATDPSVVGPEKAAAHVIGKHRQLHTSKKRYDKARDEFVSRLMELQHEFASWEYPAKAANEISEKSAIEMTQRHAIASSVGDDDDVSSDLSVSEFLKAQEPYSAESRLRQREEVKGTLTELRRVGLQNVEAETSKMKGRGRPKTGIHLKFTAIRIEENCALSLVASESHALTAEEKATSENRLVFLNNLPIDITEEEIDEIYSRCGQLDSIELFNLRPDLDPGPISNKQIRELRRNKKLRNKNTFKNGESLHHRPRTPVYGILRFKTDEGYQVATSQDLCIFGCVIRRHPVLSIRPTDMDTLYLEHIPSNLHSIDLENMLAQLLLPRHIHIMLDGWKGVGLNVSRSNLNGDHQEYSKPSGCQVKFPDFRTAFHAYHWIKDGMITDENIRNLKSDATKEALQVHWFRTPSNSMDYWTRDLGF